MTLVSPVASAPKQNTEYRFISHYANEDVGISLDDIIKLSFDEQIESIRKNHSNQTYPNKQRKRFILAHGFDFKLHRARSKYGVRYLLVSVAFTNTKAVEFRLKFKNTELVDDIAKDGVIDTVHLLGSFNKNWEFVEF